MHDVYLLDLVHITTSLTIGTRAVHIILFGILRSPFSWMIYLSII